MIILIVSEGLMNGDKCGMLIGFACGLLTDIFFGDYIGFYAMLNMMIGFLSGKLHKVFYRENYILPMVLIIIGDGLYGFMCYVLMFMFRTRFNVGFYFRSVIVPEVVYTTIAAIPVYPMLLRIDMWLEEARRRSMKKFV